MEDHHILLLAPRRVGKTSVMYRLIERVRDARRGHPLYVSAADCRSELAFVTKLYLAAAAEHPGVAKRLRGGRLKSVIGTVQSLKLSGVQVVLRDVAAREWPDVGEEFGEALRSTNERWYLLVDELPVFVLSLLREAHSLERTREFLDWFRTLRQGPPEGEDGVRWLLAGSIDLDSVAQRYGLSASINDLKIERLGALSWPETDEFLRALGSSYDVTFTDAAVVELKQRLGWLIPYHLQVVFAELRSDELRPSDTIDREAVKRAIRRLLRPGNRAYFDSWYQRLEEELGSPQHRWARALLAACARDPDGAARQSLDSVLAAELSDPSQRGEELAWMLAALENDGYVTVSGDRYRFRSHLLREYWHRRMP